MFDCILVVRFHSRVYNKKVELKCEPIVGDFVVVHTHELQIRERIHCNGCLCVVLDAFIGPPGTNYPDDLLIRQGWSVVENRVEQSAPFVKAND